MEKKVIGLIGLMTARWTPEFCWDLSSPFIYRLLGAVIAAIGVFSDEKFAGTMRFWDCCKPSCAWPGKANVSNPVRACYKDGFSEIDDLNANSGCGGGVAYTCNDNIPWAINDSLAYGFAAADISDNDESGWCCGCYKLRFTTTSISGKSMIVQVTNSVGGSLRSTFNLQIPGAGIGTNDGCVLQWGVPRDVWGNQWGGINARNQCDALPQVIRAGCYFRFDWFQGVDNPFAYFSKVKCPPELEARTQCARLENSLLEGPDKLTRAEPLRIGSTLGLIFGLYALLAFISAFIIVYFKRKHRVRTRFMQKINQSKSFTSQLESHLAEKLQFLEVPRATIIMSTDLLGYGNFGTVYIATLVRTPNESNNLTVAVKCSVNTSKDSENRFFKEASIMAEIGSHLNIVNLLGIVAKGKKLLLLEYCELGSLQKYLKCHREPFFYRQVDDCGTLLDYDEQKFQLAKQTLGERVHESDGRILSTTDLISFSYQTARGMVFLSGKNIIHRDLAARNILIDKNRIAKISDFGMAINSSDISQTTGAMPLRWMAPESIRSREFSEKSDVWSYGVLLWEIFSLGDTPYRELQFKRDADMFLGLLENGGRLEKPPESFNEMYELMQKCWSLDCRQRPSFVEVRVKLQYLIDQDYYINLDSPYEEYNLYLGNIFGKPTSLP